ncbi:MAG: hypothetical protein ACOH5I_11370 [Oligoflexus sp.]
MNCRINLKVWSTHFLFWICFFASQALSQTHAWVDQSRSSLQKNVFVSQSIDGEYGRFEKHLNQEQPSSDNNVLKQTWRGYGIQNGVGFELFKFTQFTLSHTLLNLRSKNSSLEHMNGSRISAGLNLVFSAPIGNLEFGAGVNAAQLDYQDVDKTASFVGSGHHYSIGMNYFLSPSVSVFGTGRRSESAYNNNGGDGRVEKIFSYYDSFSLGARVWF